MHNNAAKLEFANEQNEFLKDVVGELLTKMKLQTEQLHTLLSEVKKSGDTCTTNQNCVVSKSKHFWVDSMTWDYCHSIVFI